MDLCRPDTKRWIPELWAKTDCSGDTFSYHPLLFHMLDVAAVAGFVWDYHLNSRFRNRIEHILQVTEPRTFIMFIAGAHDIGKANPSFQKRIIKIAEGSGLPFSKNDQERPHGFISAHVLGEFLGAGSVSALLGQIAGGHHGVFPQSMYLQMGRDSMGNNEWKNARQNLLRELAKIVGFDHNKIAQSQKEISDPIVIPMLAGLISVVDWIGSNQEFFPCAAKRGESYSLCAEEYWEKAKKQAKEALETLGWLPSVTYAQEVAFKDVFHEFVPNALQHTVIKLISKRDSPYCIIIEAPMGHGKTEAALFAADLALCRGFARGMYVAMPTQATGNAMFKRVLDDYLKHRGHQGKLNLQLIHGDALLAQIAEVKEGEIPKFTPNDIGEEEGDVEAQAWFTAKKRPLLAPFGVGTIDQSLLSVLQTKHWFVRLFGLSGKVIIFDEVHAYDAYMSTIIERLLHWLAELDCTVILLSATLPEAKRKSLAKAYSGREDVEYKPYPRITLAHPRHYPVEQTDEKTVCAEVPINDTRQVNLLFGKTDLESLKGTLAERLEYGGCAAVICNTVSRSIEVYKHLRDNLQNTECSLFHARTLQMWRREREEEVLLKFGKRSPKDRPQRAVLVATQVIEQSLDLDFDFMVSEIAPVDLLLQRSGRLHRHNRQRPLKLEKPQFLVLCDAEKAGPPPESFGTSIEFVYDRYILLRTWLTLRERDKIEVPTEIEAFVEAVYGFEVTPNNGDWLVALSDSKHNMEFERAESENSALRLLVSKPKVPSDLIDQFNEQLVDDDDPEIHKTVRAATREGDPSITVVMLPANTALLSEPNIPEIRRMLDQSAKISHRGVFHGICTKGVTPREWAKNAHLRHARLLRLDEKNYGRVENYTLLADEKVGIVILKEGENYG